MLSTLLSSLTRALRLLRVLSEETSSRAPPGLSGIETELGSSSRASPLLVLVLLVPHQ
jgi:hypothetical protein